jgi:transcriptional regulator with XRE-family HTH domain
MDSDSRKATTRAVHDSSKALFERSKLIRERRLELQAELQLGLRRSHDLVMSCQRLAKSVSGSSRTQKPTSGNVVSRIEIRTQDVAGHLAEALKNKNALCRNPAGLHPLGNRALGDTQFTSDSRLPASGFHRFLHKVFSHNVDCITEIDTEFNAKSDGLRWHDQLVNSVQTKTTFWERLIEAAAANGVTTTQEGIAAALGIKQSAVAKWKAGGRPRMTRLEKIARDWRYNINWLLSEELPKRPAGVGEPDETAELLAIWKALNTDNKKAALAIMKQVRKGQTSRTPEKA